MTIQERLNNDVKQAMKDGNKVRRDTLRMIIDVIQKKEKALIGKELDQDGVISVVTTYKKNLHESLEFAIKANDQLAIDRLVSEIAIATEYLPQQLTDDEVRDIVIRIASELADNERNIGNIMKQLSPLVKGKADGKVVNQIVKDVLN